MQIVETYVQKVKELNKRIKRAEKRLNHEKRYSLPWYKERNRLNRAYKEVEHLEHPY